MAEVWRGVHVAQQVPVAVKVITQSSARDPLFRGSFRNEVQAAARLDHPGIVMVLDSGELAEDGEAASEGRLAAGSPYIAMELASWGSLDRLKRTLEWRELSRMLLGLLDALAHAHARGVLHRDLKPANILVSSDQDLRPGIKLSDFGIAHALEPEENKKYEVVGGGTPLFMAPEQFIGDWRSFGPWTDLYALGCLAYWFATGRPLFIAEDNRAIGVHHIRTPPPPLRPAKPMPSGFEGWLLRLLAKDPADRFQRAADAAWALARIEDDVLLPASEEPPDPPIADAPTTTLPWAIDERLLEEVTPVDGLEDGRAVMTRELPPLPFSWRTPPRPPPPPKLLGAGLGLYGIRTVPLVDRDEERDLLWGRLSRVRDQKRAEVVLVQGAAGNGKSRLVEWLCERADEVGGAIVMKTFFGPMKNPSEAIARMMARFLRAENLDRQQTRERVELALRRQGVTDEYEATALTELIVRQPKSGEQLGSVHFSTATERHNLIHRFLARTSRERPVIVWFDDVHFGNDALVYARQLLHAREADPCRVLMVMTVRDDVLADRPAEAELVEELAGRPGATRIALPRLRPGDQLKLVHELLHLERPLASEVAARTDGNPLFAVQLVDDWVRRGVLELDDSGFRLEEGETADLPGSMREVWQRRIDDLLVDEPAEAIVALEIAAILGGEIDPGEWSDACEAYGITIPAALLPSLLEVRLAYQSDGRWWFAHNMLREALEEHARERRRYQSHHRVCGAMLASRHGVDRAGVSERIGRHFSEGDSYAEALLPLHCAAIERWHASDYEQAQRLLEDYERVLASLAWQNSDPRWPECWVLRARIASAQGRYRDAITWSERARDHARYFELSGPLAGALRERAWITFVLGDAWAPRPLFDEAEALSVIAQDEIGLALTRLAMAETSYAAGDLAAAEERYRSAGDTLRERSDQVGRLTAVHGLGKVARWRGDREGARRWFRSELELAESTGNRHAYARAKAALADLAAMAGNPGPAERDYREAIEILGAIGSSDASRVRVALGLLFLAAGDRASAHRELMVVRATADSVDETHQRSSIHAALAADAAASERWTDYQDQLSLLRELLDRTGIADGDVAKTLELAAELAHSAGRSEEAEQSLALARRVWGTLRVRSPSAP